VDGRSFIPWVVISVHRMRRDDRDDPFDEFFREL